MFSQYYHIKGLQKLITFMLAGLCVFLTTFFILNTGHFDNITYNISLHDGVTLTLIVLWKKLDEIDSYAYILYIAITVKKVQSARAYNASLTPEITNTQGGQLKSPEANVTELLSILGDWKRMATKIHETHSNKKNQSAITNNTLQACTDLKQAHIVTASNTSHFRNRV
ncbi:hypothetical protein ACJX0J_035986 [Zea mays]